MNSLINTTQFKTMSSREIAEEQSDTVKAMRTLIAKYENKEQLNAVEEMAIVAMSLAGLGSAFGKNHNPVAIKGYFEKWISEDSTSKFQKRLYEDIVNLTGCELIVPDIDWSEVKAQSHERNKRNKANTKTYIILNPLTKLIKIGRSRNIKSRISTLSTSAGSNLLTLLIIDRDVEYKLHTRFSHVRQTGEWFEDVDGCITSFIERYKNGEFGFDGDGA